MKIFEPKVSIYTVHIDSKNGDILENKDYVKFIKDSFCLPAFLFNSLWLLYNRLWIPAIIWIISDIILYSAVKSGYLPFEMSFFVKFSLNLILGFIASDLQREKLSQNGYSMRCIVAAENEIAAHHRFFDKYYGKAS